MRFTMLSSLLPSGSRPNRRANALAVLDESPHKLLLKSAMYCEYKKQKPALVVLHAKAGLSRPL